MANLHRYERQIAMDSNLTQTTNRDVVERPLPFEARECPFHGLPLSIQGFPSDGVLLDSTQRIGREVLVA